MNWTMNWTLYWAIGIPLWVISLAFYFWHRHKGNRDRKIAWLRVLLIMGGSVIGVLIGHLIRQW